MREIDKIIIHCAYTPANMDIGAEEIKRWHTDEPPKGNGWSDIGYHYILRRNGAVENGRPLEVSGAHTRGHNKNSIGVCMVGGKGKGGGSECNFTHQQWAALYDLVERLTRKYPNAEVYGHNDFSTKDCPNFNAQEWWNA